MLYKKIVFIFITFIEILARSHAWGRLSNRRGWRVVGKVSRVKRRGSQVAGKMSRVKRRGYFFYIYIYIYIFL